LVEALSASQEPAQMMGRMRNIHNIEGLSHEVGVLATPSVRKAATSASGPPNRLRAGRIAR
jgi:hypothetical protein